MENLMTSEELRGVRVSQAYFARVCGISKMRVSQLLKAGLLVGDSEGVLLVESLRRWFNYRLLKGNYTLEEFLREKNAG